MTQQTVSNDRSTEPTIELVTEGSRGAERTGCRPQPGCNPCGPLICNPSGCKPDHKCKP